MFTEMPTSGILRGQGAGDRAWARAVARWGMPIDGERVCGGRRPGVDKRANQKERACASYEVDDVRVTVFGLGLWARPERVGVWVYGCDCASVQVCAELGRVPVRRMAHLRACKCMTEGALLAWALVFDARGRAAPHQRLLVAQTSGRPSRHYQRPHRSKDMHSVGTLIAARASSRARIPSAHSPPHSDLFQPSASDTSAPRTWANSAAWPFAAFRHFFIL